MVDAPRVDIEGRVRGDAGTAAHRTGRFRLRSRAESDLACEDRMPIRAWFHRVFKTRVSDAYRMWRAPLWLPFLFLPLVLRAVVPPFAVTKTQAPHSPPPT